MKTKNIVICSILGISLAGFILVGCHKDNNAPSSSSSPSTSSSSDITAAQDESNASDAMTDSKNISDAAAQNNSGEYSPQRSMHALYSAHCNVTWARDTMSGYDTMYINFGATPVKCNDNRWRKGEIIVYWTRMAGKGLIQTYFDSGSVITMVFDNYAAGNSDSTMIGVAGFRTWNNTGSNAMSEQNWNFNANLTLTYSNNQTATWVSTRSNSLVTQGGVYYYEITGNASGTDRNGYHYSLSIVNPLYFTALPWWMGGCAWIESGTITITVANVMYPITIDFGTLGSCSPVKTATINNHTYTFIMW